MYAATTIVVPQDLALGLPKLGITVKEGHLLTLLFIDNSFFFSFFRIWKNMNVFLKYFLFKLKDIFVQNEVGFWPLIFQIISWEMI